MSREGINVYITTAALVLLNVLLLLAVVIVLTDNVIYFEDGSFRLLGISGCIPLQLCS